MKNADGDSFTSMVITLVAVPLKEKATFEFFSYGFMFSVYAKCFWHVENKVGLRLKSSVTTIRRYH